MAVKVKRTRRLVGYGQIEKNEKRLKELDDEIYESGRVEQGGDVGEKVWTSGQRTDELEKERERLQKQNDGLLKRKWLTEERKERQAQMKVASVAAKGNVGG